MPTVQEAMVAAVNFHQTGQIARAEGIYRKVLQADPNQPDALNLLGVIAHQQGRHDLAVEQIGRAISLNPKGISYLNNFGLACHALGRLEKAMAAYRRALELAPKNAEVLNNLANLLHDQGNVQEAADCYQAAVALKPDYAEAHYNLGNVLKDQRRHDEAGRSYRRAIELRGDYARAHQALGNVLADLGRPEEAVASYRQVERIRSDPLLPELNIAALCPRIVRDNQEIDDYRQALLEKLNRLSGHGRHVDVGELAVFGCEPPFGLLFHGRDDRPIKEAYAAVFRNCFDQQVVPGIPPAAGTDTNPKRKRGTQPTALLEPRAGVMSPKTDEPGDGRYSDGPPRIGLFVTNSHEGIFIRCMRGILENLQPGLFELVVICLPGGIEKLRRSLDVEGLHFVVVPDRLDRAVEVIRDNRFDLLYFWEIGTDPTNYFLPFFRLAPVQCTSWGVPGTSGISQVDYYLSSDLIEAPDADAHYTEHLYRAETLLAYEYRMTLPDAPKRRSDFGLPADRNVYLCPQQLGKIHPDFDQILGGILDRDRDGLVVLVEDYYQDSAACLRRRMARAIPDEAERVVFVPRQKLPDYACLVAAADVVLDSLHYGGGITAYDAFSFDQPIVTLPTEYRRGRYALGCYRKMGIMDCVAATAEEYVEIAVRLGTDREYRESIRARIRMAAGVLFEDLESVREFERFLLSTVRQSRSTDRSRQGD